MFGFLNMYFISYILVILILIISFLILSQQDPVDNSTLYWRVIMDKSLSSSSLSLFNNSEALVLVRCDIMNFNQFADI